MVIVIILSMRLVLTQASLLGTVISLLSTFPSRAKVLFGGIKWMAKGPLLFCDHKIYIKSMQP